MNFVTVSFMLVLGASALSLETPFLKGIASGLLKGEFCLQNQQACGEAFGELAAVMYQAKDVVRGGNTIDWPNVTNLNNFLYGFANGVKNPNKTTNCYQDVNRFIGDVSQLYSGIIAITNSINLETISNLGCDINQFYQFSFDKDCNIDALIHILENLTEASLVHNYVESMCTINNYILGLRTCTSNYKTCGYDAGRVFSLLINWSL